jgi:CDP-paratose 2-epimerase
MSLVTHRRRVARAARLRKVTAMIAARRGGSPGPHFAAWRPGAKPCYACDIRAIGAALDWSPRMAMRDGLRGLDRWLDARFARSARPPELQEAHA